MVTGVGKGKDQAMGHYRDKLKDNETAATRPLLRMQLTLVCAHRIKVVSTGLKEGILPRESPEVGARLPRRISPSPTSTPSQQLFLETGLL